MEHGQTLVRDAFSGVMGQQRGLCVSLEAERRAALGTGLTKEQDDVIRAFVRGGLTERKSVPTGLPVLIWAVPRAEGSDDAFLSVPAQFNLIAARVNGKVLAVARLTSFWRCIPSGIRLICADENVACEVPSDSQMRSLMDEYRRTYTAEKTDILLGDDAKEALEGFGRLKN